MISTNGLFLFSDRIESKYTCILGGWLFDYTLGHQPVDYSYSPTALRVSIPVYKVAGCLITLLMSTSGLFIFSDRIESKYTCIQGGWLFDYTPDVNQWIIHILPPH